MPTAARGQVPTATWVRAGFATALAGVLLGTTAACGSGDDAPDEGLSREEPGPTLAEGPPPAEWQDVRSAHGLVYSVPPDWEIGDPFGEPSPSGPDADAPDRAAEGSDWGSGFITTANAIADRGYCPLSGLSFRTLAGISAVLPGQARDEVESASRAVADSIDRRFTAHGADVPVPEPRKIGVSGVPAWHISLRGEVRPPRNICTPPVIRFDTIAVATQTPDGAPATIVFVLMADEGEEDVQPEATIDAVVASLRYDNSL